MIQYPLERGTAMFNIKKKIKKLLNGSRADSKTYVSFLRNSGCTIGDKTVFYDPASTTVDVTRPWLITIGNNVKITKGVTILTHGYDWSVLKNLYHEAMGSSGKVSIGDNVFIGVNSTILKGVTIGNNVIIGANSLVNKNIPDNVVVAGNPARVIMSIDDYYKKRKEAHVNDAKELAVEYYKKYNELPPISKFHEFFPLFLERDKELFHKHGFSFSDSADPEKDLEAFLNSKPMFNGYNDFLKWCGLV